MNKADINDALTGRLENNLSGANVSYPNVDSKHDRPWYEVSINATGRETGLKGTVGAGTILREDGILTVVVADDLDKGEYDTNVLAQAVADLFPAGTKLAITGGEITVQSPPEIRGGFRDGSEWRVPVVVSYSANAS